jgi:hypothetical protein
MSQFYEWLGERKSSGVRLVLGMEAVSQRH